MYHHVCNHYSFFKAEDDQEQPGDTLSAVPMLAICWKKVGNKFNREDGT